MSNIFYRLGEFIGKDLIKGIKPKKDKCPLCGKVKLSHLDYCDDCSKLAENKEWEKLSHFCSSGWHLAKRMN